MKKVYIISSIRPEGIWQEIATAATFDRAAARQGALIPHQRGEQSRGRRAVEYCNGSYVELQAPGAQENICALWRFSVLANALLTEGNLCQI